MKFLPVNCNFGLENSIFETSLKDYQKNDSKTSKMFKIA